MKCQVKSMTHLSVILNLTKQNLKYSAFYSDTDY